MDSKVTYPYVNAGYIGKEWESIIFVVAFVIWNFHSVYAHWVPFHFYCTALIAMSHIINTNVEKKIEKRKTRFLPPPLLLPLFEMFLYSVNRISGGWWIYWKILFHCKKSVTVYVFALLYMRVDRKYSATHISYQWDTSLFNV